MADFDEAYKGVETPSPFMKRPAPQGFIASYPPVTPIGQEGPFFVNTYFLQSDRNMKPVVSRFLCVVGDVKD